MFGRFRPVHYLNHAWATKIAHGERLRGPVSRGIAKCHNVPPCHPATQGYTALYLVRASWYRRGEREGFDSYRPPLTLTCYPWQL